MSSKKISNFRYDINGLRAIAIICVLVFHYNESYLRGGFVGVDIFFVLSGFLMTSIIDKEISKNKLDIFSFYISRARRIVPALIVICSLLIVIGFIFIEPSSYQILGRHIVSSLSFMSNFVYYHESGYFDQSSREKFLLHTWSLSVEWQFYLIYPFVMILIYKFKNRISIFHSILILTLTLFFISLITTKINSNLSYFMFFSRSWEMLIGGLVYYSKQSRIAIGIKKHSLFLEVIGLILIFTSCFTLTPSHGWPNIYSIIPVIATCMILYVNNENTIFKTKPLQLIGNISYSLYLVHWPVIVLMRKLGIEINFIEYIFVSFALAIILYYSVERKREFSVKWLILYVAIMTSSSIVCYNGLAIRVDSNSKYKMTLSEYRNKNEGNLGIWSDEPIYFNSSENDFEYILIGSSHARHYYSFLKKSKLKVVSLALDGCNSTKNYYTDSGGNVCRDRYNYTINFIKKHPNKKIIWATLWTWMGSPRDNTTIYKDNNQLLEGEISLFIQDINGYYKKLFLLGDVPGTKNLIFECLAKNSLPINKYIKISNCPEYQPDNIIPEDNILKNISSKNVNTYFVKSSNALCHKGKCQLIDKGEPIYTDYGHLSRIGSDIVGKYIEKNIN